MVCSSEYASTASVTPLCWRATPSCSSALAAGTPSSVAVDPVGALIAARSPRLACAASSRLARGPPRSSS
jgi:hypothetical protein